jgi:hypothetical protein
MDAFFDEKIFKKHPSNPCNDAGCRLYFQNFLKTLDELRKTVFFSKYSRKEKESPDAFGQ